MKSQMMELLSSTEPFLAQTGMIANKKNCVNHTLKNSDTGQDSLYTMRDSMPQDCAL